MITRAVTNIQVDASGEGIVHLDDDKGHAGHSYGVLGVSIPCLSASALERLHRVALSVNRVPRCRGHG